MAMITRIDQKVAKLERHLNVLELTIEDGPVTTVSLNDELDYSRREIRYSLRMLENEALIEETPQGLVATDNVDEFINKHVIQINSIIHRLDAITVPHIKE